MNVLVLYDSVFGNTEKIARQIAEALLASLPEGSMVELLQPGKVKPYQLENSDLLVIGSPTRGFRPTEDLANLLDRLGRNSLRGVRVAAFDTRFKADEVKSAVTRFVVKTGGYAAKRIADRLQKAGAVLVAPLAGFYVADIEGPLLDGELERAAAWARHDLAHQVVGNQPSGDPL